jgi:hypothetical protein
MQILKTMLIAFLFGLAALILQTAGINIPVWGDQIHLDLREPFVLIGSAITGIPGAILIGVMSQNYRGFLSPLYWGNLASHLSAAIFTAIIYRLIYSGRLKRFLFPAGWMVISFLFYEAVLIPVFILTLKIFFNSYLIKLLGTGSFLESYVILVKISIIEVLITTGITAIVMVTLPEKFRRPSLIRSEQI